MIEKILAAGLLLGLIIRDGFGFGRFDQGIMIFGLLLAITYLFFNWWTNKPQEVNLRTVIITLLYGVALSALTFAVIFNLLYLTGSVEMTIVSIAFSALIIVIDLITSIKRTKVLNPLMLWRLAILMASLVIMSSVDEQQRISITYRKYPGFLNYYKANKGKQDFYTLQKMYFDTQRDNDNQVAI
jgi:hypothetical protein